MKNLLKILCWLPLTSLIIPPIIHLKTKWSNEGVINRMPVIHGIYTGILNFIIPLIAG